MQITIFACGPIETNAYLVADPPTHEAIIVDAPPESAAQLLDAVRSAEYTVSLIVLTHHHWDHVVDANTLRAETGAPIAAHPDSLPDLRAPRSPSMPTPVQVEPVEPDRLLREGDEVAMGAYTFKVLHTPGHAPGEISLYNEPRGILFGGDTLFQDGYGRIDIPGASLEQTAETLAKLLTLPDDVTVYPGHGSWTTIGAERGWMSAVTRRRQG